jgi:hypothetical protein
MPSLRRKIRPVRMPLEKYLQAFPSGAHASEARTCIETFDWESASKAGRVSVFEKYLAIHPDGQHVEAAKTAIAEGRARVNREDAEKLTLLMRGIGKGRWPFGRRAPG